MRTSATKPQRSKKRAERLEKIIGLVILTIGAVAISIPLLWMISSSLKGKNAVNAFPPQWIPREPVKVELDGRACYLYDIPIDGEMRRLALYRKNGPTGIFVDPENPEEQYEAPVLDGKRVTRIKFHWENFGLALKAAPFARYALNTLIIVVFGTIGTLLSCTLVAYGFARFRAPGMNWLFLLLLATVMLPPQVTLIPTFILFTRIHWYDTLYPLIVPTFFANAWDVFLLRQFFMSLPRELDEAAIIDGCSYWCILWKIIVPQSFPALATVAIFTMLYAWNDFYEPLIYLQSPEHWTLALGLQGFNALYAKQGHLLMAASLMMVVPPVLIFFFAQRLFIQGVVVSGIKG